MYLYKGFIVPQKEYDRVCLKSIIENFTAYDEFLKTLYNFLHILLPIRSIYYAMFTFSLPQTVSCITCMACCTSSTFLKSLLQSVISHTNLQ